MRNAYIKALYELSEIDSRIVSLIADNGAIVFDKYREAFPERLINAGIAEANMIGMAAGMASTGLIPFAYTISNFITFRAYEQVRNDVCLQNMNVKLVGIGVGFAYSNLGPTHHNTEDITVMRVLPGLTIFSPSDPLETYNATVAAAKIEGPVYLRITTGGTPKIYDAPYEFKLGYGVTLTEGSDITIIATGSIVYETLQAVDILKKCGINARLINIHTIKPFDTEIILKAINETGALLSVEEHSVIGGLGSCISEIIAESGHSVKFKRMGLNDTFPVGYGTYDEMRKINGLDKDSIVNEAKTLIHRGKY
ncbi:transketolase family protein [Candidatus Magnetomonas plexicatena]|uniref:transketolase family protein n=1 Tax=Candidatus Magnetomonas plexicatena TaxID=2552947 RepID=UPI001C76270C|nr:transketolase [Nitrospirales bacterium LBB_01]